MSNKLKEKFITDFVFTYFHIFQFCKNFQPKAISLPPLTITTIHIVA